MAKFKVAEYSGKAFCLHMHCDFFCLQKLSHNILWTHNQVEWDEPGFGERQNRVNVWEIETPENPFICPSPISSLKRPFHPGFLGTH